MYTLHSSRRVDIAAEWKGEACCSCSWWCTQWKSPLQLPSTTLRWAQSYIEQRSWDVICWISSPSCSLYSASRVEKGSHCRLYKIYRTLYISRMLLRSWLVDIQTTGIVDEIFMRMLTSLTPYAKSNALHSSPALSWCQRTLSGNTPEQGTCCEFCWA